MKILTINTHSLQEENYQQKLEWFIEALLREKPDSVAMQEVNQTATEEQVDESMLLGQFPVPGCMTIRRDNHAARVAYRLHQAGVHCSWAWLPIKLGYGKYDEGVAILSLGRNIRAVDAFPISKCNDFSNWKTRKVLGVQFEGMDDWFYTVHMGWWGDEEEPFLHQWKVLNSCIAAKRMCGPVWLMGDFNAPSTVRGESYDHILKSGWHDTFLSAARRDDGITVPGVIDGWRDKLPAMCRNGMRVDYIWCSKKQQVLSSYVIFNGRYEPVISDHFGILTETKGVRKS